MHPRIYTLALVAASGALAGAAHAAEDCGKTVVHSVSQSCTPLPNGLNLCQPVALMGPPASCRDASSPPLKPVPLAFPTLQMPQTAAPAHVPPQGPAYTPPQFQWPPFPAPQAAAPAPAPAPQAQAPHYQVPQYTPPQIQWPQFQWPQFPAPQYQPPQFAVPQFPLPQWPSFAAPTPAPKPHQAPEPAAPAKPETAAIPAPAAVPAPDVAQPAPPAAAKPLAAPALVPSAIPAPVAVPVPAPGAAPAAVAPVQAPTPVVGVPDVRAHFDFDSAELTEAGRKALDDWLDKAPVGMPVLVSGYADRLGREPYNLELSLRRAMAARDYLVSKGKDARDIRVVAKGETSPLKHCKGKNTPATKACLAPNRRVEIAPE